jgi:hypothetical protein
MIKTNNSDVNQDGAGEHRLQMKLLEVYRIGI